VDRFTPDLVSGWIDENKVREVELVDEDEDEFLFRIKLHHIPATIIVESDGSPLEIVTQVTYDPSVLANLMDRAQLWKQFRTEAMIVLTGLRGFYAFLNDDGDTVSFEEMSQIRIQYFMYPDGASQHEFMNSMYDLARAHAYLLWRPENIVETLDDRS